MNSAPLRKRVYAITWAITAAALGAHAADAPAPAAAPDPARLKTLERQVEQSSAERDKLKTESAGVNRDLAAIRQDLIATAKDVQDQERSLTLMENRVADLTRDADRMAQTLALRDVQMREVLLALERLALHPGDALALNPLSPDDAVRAAILLRAALPHIKQSEATLADQLKDLYRLRAEAAAQRQQAVAANGALIAKRARLTALEAEKSQHATELASRSETLDAHIAQMAREAQDLRDLFAKLEEEEKARREAAAANTPAPNASANAAPGGNHESAVTRSFAKARGTMPFPVAGTLTGRYGEATGGGEDPSARAKGITITTRAGAQVVAPFDGIIAFAGPFRGYGQLLIIEHSEGYHTLLAGLGRIDAAVGQHVLAGEPVGVMEDDGAPSLYVELRRDGQPINPLPWLADRAGKNSG